MPMWLKLTRHNGTPFIINVARIMSVEPCPDPEQGSLVYPDPKRPIAVNELYDDLIEKLNPQPKAGSLY